MAKIRLVCNHCGKEIFKYKSLIKTHTFCNKECYNLWMKTHNKGKNNPNYKHGRHCTEHYCFFCGKVIDRLGRSLCCHKCKAIHFPTFKNKTHSDYSKKIIGIKSSLKFTEEFRKRFRRTMEERGLWIPLNHKTKYDIYYNEANWVDGMTKFLSEEEYFRLKKVGMLNTRTNSKGLVRDHKYSRRSGFLNKVFPEILRHPCNCQFISNPENISKKTSRYIDRNDITLSELFIKIETFDLYWKEHSKCLELIQYYRIGGIWSKY